MSQFSTPEGLEKHHVRDVYEKIAPYFIGSRHKAWPRVEQFLLSLPVGSLIADVGCGTGKYLGLAPESFVVGSDSCLEFSEIAAAMGHNVVACDNQNLPFRNSCFDAVISIGVIHHFASVKRRMKAVEELYRILQPGGKMLVYVWAFEQEERKFDGQDVLVPYTHYQRNKVLARRSQSTLGTPKLYSHIQSRSPPDMAASSWRSRRAFSFDDSRQGHNQLRSYSPIKRGLRKQDHVTGLNQNTVPSKYDVLQRIRRRDKEPTFDWSQQTEETPVAKLSKFLNSVIKKIFDDDDSGETTSSYSQAEGRSQNDLPLDTNTDFGTDGSKVQALMSYFSIENREKYSTGEFFSMLAKKLFAGKDDLRLHEISGISADSEGLKPKVNGEHGPCDVVVCMKEKAAKTHAPWGKMTERMNGVSLSVMAKLVESVASSSDVDSDSSSSSDYLTSDSSAAEDWERPGTTLPAHGGKAFQHTTVNCEELGSKADSLYSSSSSLFSSSSSSASSSCSSLAESDSQRKVKSKLFQRYYHVFCAGELVKLIQDGIPSAIVLNEYCDHGNWAVVLEKKVEETGDNLIGISSEISKTTET